MLEAWPSNVSLRSFDFGREDLRTSASGVPRRYHEVNKSVIILSTSTAKIVTYTRLD